MMTIRTERPVAPPRLLPLVHYTRTHLAEHVTGERTGKDGPFLVPRHVVTGSLQRGFMVTRSFQALLDAEADADERLVEERFRTFQAARDLRPEGYDWNEWETAIVIAMRTHREPVDVLETMRTKVEAYRLGRRLESQPEATGATLGG